MRTISFFLGDVEAALQVSMRAGREGRPEHHIYSRDYMPTLLHGVYGLGSKDFNKYDVGAVIENMHATLERRGDRIVRDFFVGVEGPYTLTPQPLPGYVEREVGMTFIGIGAEGVKTALETAAYIYSEDCGDAAQIRPVRGALRSGEEGRRRVHEPSDKRLPDTQQLRADRARRARVF